MDTKPWWESIKVVVFLTVFIVLSGGLLTLLLTGTLATTTELVGGYATAVVALASSLFVGRGLGSVGRGLGARPVIQITPEDMEDES